MTHIDIDKLPDDPTKLKAVLWEREQRVHLLEHQVFLLQRHSYGPTSEKLSSAQQTFEFAREAAVEDLPEPQAEQREEKAARRKSQPCGRRPFPPEWPRVDVIHALPESELICPCCLKPMAKIGEEVSEELDYIPPQCRVKRNVRYKYACQDCHEGVKIAPPPVKVVEQGLASSSTVATVIVDKFDDHLPLYRQSERFARLGFEISRGTLCSWVGQGAERLRPLWDWMRRNVIGAPVIWTDDTPVKVLEPGRGKTRTARFWVYLGDETHPYAVFDFTPSRRRDGPEKFLKTFKGYLQADAYRGYDGICAGLNVLEVACWAHARRKFFESQETDRKAQEMLLLIGELYAIEDVARPIIEAARAKVEPERTAALAHAYALRQQLRELKARPVLERIRICLEAQRLETLPKSPLGQAVQYAKNQWMALTRYVENGILEIDNNTSERTLRDVAVGRKNWLFLGNDASGERAAILYSIIATCKRHDVNPWEYLKDVLLRVSTHPASRIEELLPQNWRRLFGTAQPP